MGVGRIEGGESGEQDILAVANGNELRTTLNELFGPKCCPPRVALSVDRAMPVDFDIVAISYHKIKTSHFTVTSQIQDSAEIF